MFVAASNTSATRLYVITEHSLETLAEKTALLLEHKDLLVGKQRERLLTTRDITLCTTVAEKIDAAQTVTTLEVCCVEFLYHRLSDKLNKEILDALL